MSEKDDAPDKPESASGRASGFSAGWAVTRQPLPPQLRHELCTPLNQIIGYSQMLQEEATESGQESFVSDLKKIESAGTRLLQLIDSLTDPSAIARITGSGRWPVVPQAAATAAVGAISGKQQESASLLVVDDNEMNRDMLARRLKQKGYQVAVAEGGREALEMIGREPFDLVLLDVMMPEVSGIDVLKGVRQSFSLADLPIIMATAKDAGEDIVEALNLGANDYVTKPLDFPVVVARVETQLSLKRATEQIKRLNSDLQQAQDRIATLMDSSPEAMRDIARWSQSIANDLAPVVGAERIGVWILDDEISPTADTAPELPSPDELRDAYNARSFIPMGNQIVIPVAGMSGEVVAALTAKGTKGAWGNTETRLLVSFAHQLGGLLELRRMQNQLAAAEERKNATRQEMLDRGIDLLRVCPACGACYNQSVQQCPTDEMELREQLLPYCIGERYRLVHILGQGGMGTVYHAHDLRLEREVALKVILPEVLDDSAARLRFEQEARAVARIDHPAVVRVYDSGELEDGSGFLVMEKLEGCDLGQLVKTFGPGTPQQVAMLLREAGDALAAAHRAAVIHRDIKLENFFLLDDRDGFRVKLLDFGLAKAVDMKTHLTQAGMIMGTPAYMAPEQISGKELDARSDIYSFAAVGYEALVGRPVVLAKDFGHVVWEVMQAEPPLVSSLLPGTPAAVDEAFRLALSKDREQRPSDVKQWVTSFVDLLESIPASTKGWPPPSTCTRRGSFYSLDPTLRDTVAAPTVRKKVSE